MLASLLLLLLLLLGLLFFFFSFILDLLAAFHLELLQAVLFIAV
jgi:hypothetical protein